MDFQINQKIIVPRSNEMTMDWMGEQQSTLPTETELLIQTLIPIKQDPNYPYVRKLVLPYTTLQSRFAYLDSLKIAEIDSLFRVCPRSPLSPYFPSLLAYTSSILVNAVDIGGGPGAYTEYFQFRYVNSMTFGFTKNEWDLKVLDPHRLIRFYGDDNFTAIAGPYTGYDDNSEYLFVQQEDFVSLARQQFMVGVDFVSATANDNDDLVGLLQLYLILSTIKDGANAILKLRPSWTIFMSQIIFLAGQSFDELHMFQPLVSGSDSDEVYLVLKHAKSERNSYFIALKELFKNLPKDRSVIKGFMKNNLPLSFLEHINEIKNEFQMYQAQTLLEIQKYLRDPNVPDRPKIDIALKLKQWALPDPY